MEQFNFRYRTRTRFIAIVDIVLSSMSLGIDFILIIFAGVASTSLGERLDRASLYFILVMWTAALTCTAAIILQVIAAVKLLTASEAGKQPEYSLKMCKFWRAVTMFFMTLIVVNLFCHPEVRPLAGLLFLLANILVRGTSIYVVVQYMKELESAIAYSVGNANIIMPCNQHSSGAVYFYYNPPSDLPIVEPPPPSYDDCIKPSMS